jgi:Hint-domain/U-box domain/von Willebrand factor type A domain/VWA / Hh  protein intein-like
MSIAMNSVIPDEFLCPITGEIMMDPVNVCAEGHIFERAAINRWSAEGQNNCPTCRTPLGSHRPERHLKSVIQAWLSSTGATSSSAATLGPSFKDATLQLTGSTFLDGAKNFLHIRAQCDPTSARQPIIVLIALDNSGSMAEMVDPDNKEILYTRMDLARHTVNVVANMLGPLDSLGVVSFSTSSKLVMDPTLMDDAGKAKIKAVLQTVQPDGSTNIDAAVRGLMNMANRSEMTGKNIFAALLTDGEETVIPSPSGTVKALCRLEMKNQWNFSTFGFGYNLNSVLLSQLSEMPTSGGSFGFIPDLTMIGTIFINWIANALSTGVRNTEIGYSVNGAEPVFIHSGPISVSQPRDFLVQIPAGANVKLYHNGLVVDSLSSTAPELVLAQHYYMEAIEQMISVANSGRSDATFSILAKVIQRFADTTNPNVKALLRDIESSDPTEGQIGMAGRYWDKWGAHYARSYLRAQKLQRRLNFKDPGSLIYGGSDSSLFSQFVSAGEQTFMTLEPPLPTGQSYSSAPRAAPTTAQVSAYLTQQSMSAYSGGCFQGDMLVRLADGEHNYLKCLRPGDLVWTTTGPAEVIALVTIGHSKAKSLVMSKVQNCVLTPYHPYLNEQNQWVTGMQTVGFMPVDITTVYNLVLSNGHIIDVGGIKACTLAHGFKGPVIEHPFFGTEAVINDLKKCDGWASGYPSYKNLEVRRENGVIVEWFDAP